MSRLRICLGITVVVALASAPDAVAQTSTPTRTNTPAVTATPTATGTAVSATATRTPTAAVGAPTTAAQCMNGGWRNFTNPTFKNQGDCVSFVASQGRAKGNPEYTRTPTPAP